MTNNLIAIAIDQYYRTPQLSNCVRDASNIIDVLVDKYEFNLNNITLLKDSQASRQNLINQLEIALSNQSKDENLIILFSGHGDFDEQLDMGYILPFESAFGDKVNSIPNSTIIDYIKAFNYKHLVLLFDSCFSGSVFSQNRGIIQSPKERLFEIPSKWALSSGRLQLVSDGKQGENSPFASSIIKNLKSNNEELLSIAEISKNVVIDVSGLYNQIPRGEPLQLLGHKGGEFMFKLKKIRGGAKVDKVNQGDYNDQLLEVLETYYQFQDKILESENDDKIATLNKFIDESNSIANFFRKEIIKIFEFKKQSKEVRERYEEIVNSKVFELTKNINNVKIEKINAANQQLFEDAVRFYSEEQELLMELNKFYFDTMKVIFSILKYDENDIPYDYSILKLVSEIPFAKTNFTEYLDENFINLYFLKLSYDNNYITKYYFWEKFDYYKNEIISYMKNQFESVEIANSKETENEFIAPKIEGIKIYSKRKRSSNTAVTRSGRRVITDYRGRIR